MGHKIRKSKSPEREHEREREREHEREPEREPERVGLLGQKHTSPTHNM